MSVLKLGTGVLLASIPTIQGYVGFPELLPKASFAMGFRAPVVKGVGFIACEFGA